jgi:hypothetical protein
VAGFSISNVEPPSSKELRREGGRWVELTRDHVQQWALLLMVLNLWVLLPDS